jgi:hypothetical protein
MKLAEYDTMNSIINDLDANDIEQLKDYASDCEMLGAKKTAKFIKCCHNTEQAVDLGVVRMLLVEDFSGI